MSSAEPTLGTPVNLGDLQIAQTCNDAVTVSDWQVTYVGGQLQVVAYVSPVENVDGIAALTVAAANPNTYQTFCGANSSYSGQEGTPGETIGAFAFTNLYDPKVHGPTIQAFVYGLLLRASGTCSFSFQKIFEI